MMLGLPSQSSVFTASVITSRLAVFSGHRTSAFATGRPDGVVKQPSCQSFHVLLPRRTIALLRSGYFVAQRICAARFVFADRLSDDHLVPTLPEKARGGQSNRSSRAKRRPLAQSLIRGARFDTKRNGGCLGIATEWFPNEFNFRRRSRTDECHGYLATVEAMGHRNRESRGESSGRLPNRSTPPAADDPPRTFLASHTPREDETGLPGVTG